MSKTILFLGAALLSASFLSCATGQPQGYVRLAADVQPARYELFINPHLDSGAFEGVETIDVALGRPTREILLHSSGLVIDEAKADGIPASVKLDPASETARLRFDDKLVHPTAKLFIRWHGRMSSESEGFYHTKDRGHWYGLTQFEPTYARRLFPCFDEPAQKAVFKISVEVDRGLAAVSNGKILSRKPSGTAGRELVEFTDSPRMSSYLVALAVGPFSRASKGNISVYMPAGREGLGQMALAAADESVRFYNRYFGIPYPFEKLDMVACPNFSISGMENAGAIFYAEAAVLLDPRKASKSARHWLFGLISHEIAHQWFGDYVTMKWWDDLWLNEAFATFMASKATESVHPDYDEDQDQVASMAYAMARDSYPSTHPVHSPVKTPGEAESQFDAITYQKGAAALKMLETYVRPEKFRRGIHDYLKAHRFANATSADLWEALAQVAGPGRDVQGFAHSWFDLPGVPSFHAQLDCPAPALQVSQERFYYDDLGAPESKDARWPIPVCMRKPDQRKPECLVLSKRSESLAAGNPCPAWIYPNANASGYFRTHLSEGLRAALLPHMGSLSAAERRAFWLIDSWPEFKRGWIHAFDLFDTMEADKAERNWRIWSDFDEGLIFFRWVLVNEKNVPHFEKYVESLYLPVFERVEKMPNPKVDDRTLKSVAFGALGELTSSPRIEKLSKEWLKRYESAPAKFDPELTDVTLRVAARFGDAKLWEHYYERGLKQTDPRDRMRYLGALGNFRDPALIRKTLALSLDRETLHDQERAAVLRSLSANLVARETVSHWIRDHWAGYSASLPHSFMYHLAMPAIGQVCTPEEVDQITAFFAVKNHRPDGFDHDIDTILDNAKKCVELRLQESREVHRWLKNFEKLHGQS